MQDTSDATGRRRGLGLGRTTWLVAKKELTVAFRDRQTWITSVLVPLLLYPLMFFAMLVVVGLVQNQQQARDVEIALGAAPGQEHQLAGLAAALSVYLDKRVEGAAQRILGDVATGAVRSPGAEAPGEQQGLTGFQTCPGIERTALERRIGAERASVEAAADPTPRSAHDIEALLWLTDEGTLELAYDSARPASLLAKERLEDALDKAGRAARESALAPTGVRLSDLMALRVEQKDLAEATDIGAFVLSMLLPMMLVVMGMLGAFYPAVDLTAGEHERKSYETGLIAPIPRLGLASGKLLAVSISAAIGATMNLIGIGLAANFLLGMLGGGSKVVIEIPWILLLAILPLLLAFLVLVSAVLTAAASLTETFKQGQSLLGSVQLVFILPAVVSTLPTLQLTYPLAATPIVGFTLAVRQVLRTKNLEDLPFGPLAMCFFAHLALAALATVLAARLMTRSPDSGSGVLALKQLLKG